MDHTLRTLRLSARWIDETLTPQLTDFFRHNRSFLRPFEPLRDENFYTLEGQQQQCRQIAQQNSDGNTLSLALSLHGEERVIGTIALNGILRGSLQRGYLSCRIDQEFQNRGLATEALTLLVSLAFEKLKLHRLEAQIMPVNAPSIHVVQKLGFFLEGMAQSAMMINGQWEDLICFALLNPEDHHRRRNSSASCRAFLTSVGVKRPT